MTCLCNPHAELDAERAPNCPIHGIRASVAQTAPSYTLERELSDLLNRHSAENASNTPDFILAGYLNDCLAAFNRGVNARTKWYAPGPIEPEPTLAECSNPDCPVGCPDSHALPFGDDPA